MVKSKNCFVCQECGYKSSGWLGRCPDCNQWNSLVEEVISRETRHESKYSSMDPPKSLSDVEVTEGVRAKTGIKEFDRILGGGIVPGSVVLVGGEPGIGKSTLLLQASNRLSENGGMTLYVSGEESLTQTKLRANRLKEKSAENLYIVSETNLNLILKHIEKLSPRVVIIDSIQVLYDENLSSSPGSVSQVRDCAGELVRLAKGCGISIFLVGHVTKEGSIAGPKVLEHMVDTVLYFEGELHTNFRILRAVKNRFGPTNEIGVFQMSDKGLLEVQNPSEMFLSERPTDTKGSIIVPTIEGTRPFLVEIQSLVSNVSFGMPRRWTQGVDYNRTTLLIAVLEKRAGLRLQSQDIFVNVAGGVKIDEPAVDLGIAVAIASSFKESPTYREDVAFGEVGLSGEVRAVSQSDVRIQEAKRLGFKRCIISKSNLNSLSSKAEIEIIGIKTVKEALDIALEA